MEIDEAPPHPATEPQKGERERGGGTLLMRKPLIEQGVGEGQLEQGCFASRTW